MRSIRSRPGCAEVGAIEQTLCRRSRGLNQTRSPRTPALRIQALRTQTPDTRHQTPDTRHQTPDTGHRAHRIAIRGHSSGSNDGISFIAHGGVGALLLTDLVGAPMDRSTDQPGLGFFCVRRQALGSPARLEATRLVQLRRDTEFPASGGCDTSTAGQGQRHIWPAATTRMPLAPSSESVASSAKASRTRPVTASRGSTW